MSNSGEHCTWRWWALAAVPAYVLPVLAHADVWKYVDERGTTHYTNQQPRQPAERIILTDPTVPMSMAPTRGKVGEVTEAQARGALAAVDAKPAYHAARATLSAAASATGVDVRLLKSVATVESAFDANAVSPKGAVGIMQLMPTTAMRYGVRHDGGVPLRNQLTQPETNIHTGARYLADLLRRFDGSTELALAAYNAGEMAVERAGKRIPRIDETQAYVKKVMAVYRVLQQQPG